VIYACLEVCLSSFHKILGSPLQGELTFLVEFDASFDLPWFEGELVICLGLRGSWCFIMYIVYFAFLLHCLYIHLSHFVSPVILACICLIMLITVLV
jgi:hypothetical protein